MMLHTCSSTDFGNESFHSRLFSSSKPSKTSISPLKPRFFLGFDNSGKGQLYPIPYSSFVDSCAYEQNPNRRTGVFTGFKVKCHSKTLTLPIKGSSINGKKKRYGGVLPSILKSLESSDDIEYALSTYCENLSPKEQTVVLKEQRSCDKILRVFQFFRAQKDYAPNVIHYNILLRALGRAQKWDELRRYWIEMARSGVLPTNNTYSMLLDVYGKAGLVKESLLWIKHMRLRGIFPDEVTMNTVIKVFKDAREFDRASKFYGDWCVGKVEVDSLELNTMVESKSSKSAPISFKHFILTDLFNIGGKSPLNSKNRSNTEEGFARKPLLTSTYNTLIDLYGKAGRLKEAADVFSEMLKSGVRMDTITFNTMIYTCGTNGLLSEAESLLKKMEDRGIFPDTKTYNIFISLYAEAGNMENALKCYRNIRNIGLFPDVVTYRAVLHILCERNMVEEVDVVLKDMEVSKLKVDEHSVPGIVKMYINKGLFDQAKNICSTCRMSSKTRAAIIDLYAEKGIWTEAEAVFYANKDLIDVIEYNVMFKAYGKAKLFDKAFSLFEGMRNHGTWPDECTYNTLIQMFSGGDLADQAKELLGEMREAGLKPQCMTFTAFISCYVRLGQLSNAVNVFDEMTRFGVIPNEIVYGSLIDGFAETGDVENALHYFHLMKKDGIAENQIVLTSLIKGYGKIGCLEKAQEVYQKIKLFEGGPDLIVSNSMISLYADLDLVTEAKSVFDNLRKNGVADGVSFATMMYLYKNLGMLDEAIDIAEEMKSSGLLSDCVSYNKVMACYAANSQLRECGLLLNEMLTKKLLPDGKTFKALFTVLRKGGFSVEAVTQLESFYQEGKPFARQAVFTSVFSVVGLQALALEFCETFLKTEVELGSCAYNVAIHAYSSFGEINKALKIFMKMQDESLEPDVVTYINLVRCYSKAGMVEGVKRIYSLLNYGEVEPNRSLFEEIIHAYEILGRDDLAKLAEQEMKFVIGSQGYDGSETGAGFDDDFSLETEDDESMHVY